MKTSTKLLIAFFAAVPLTLWGFNLMIKEQYLRGNFKFGKPTPPHVGMVKHLLPEFNHLVINGAILTKSGPLKTFMPLVKVGFNYKPGALYVHRQLDKLIRIKKSGDTLFVTIEKEKVNADLVADHLTYEFLHNALDFSIPAAKSYSLTNGRFYFSPGSDKYTRINGRIVDFQPPAIKFYAENSRVTLAGGMPVEHLEYELGDNAKLSIPDTKMIKKLTRLGNDTHHEEIINENMVIITPRFTYENKKRIANYDFGTTIDNY